MQLRRGLVTGMFLLSGLQGVAFAEETVIHVGDRVRIKAPELAGGVAPAMLRKEKISLFTSETFIVGRVEGFDGRTLALSTSAVDSALTVPMRNVAQLDVWSAGDHRTTGTLLGFLGGAVIGGLIGHAAERDETPPGQDPDPGCASYVCSGDWDLDLDWSLSPTVQGVLVGAVIGTVTGRLIGSTIRRDRWKGVEVRRFGARVAAVGGDKVGIACSVSF